MEPKSESKYISQPKPKFKGSQYPFTLLVDKHFCIKMHKNTLHLKNYKERRGWEGKESFHGTFLLAIEREPGYFSMHDMQNKNRCFAVSSEWSGVHKHSESSDYKMRVGADGPVMP